MKLLLAITCLLIYANCVSSHGIRAKRGFSEAQQKKFIDAVNRDRSKIEKVTGVKMVPLTYYSELERRAEVLDCNIELRGDIIQFDSVGRELYEIARKNRETMLPQVFNPSVTEVGCAKKNCDHKVNANFIGPSLKPFVGKKITFLGICMTDLPGYAFSQNKSFVEALHRTILPPPFAYGDILGIPTENQDGSEAGSVFSLIISLFLVLYI
ncbi:unnamed protein product [Caenorhabditis brenneri]